MAYKRNIDRLPIIPAGAKEHNVTCHYCIVGCGYKAYTWDINKQGGTEPSQNKFKADLSKQEGADSAAWYSPEDSIPLRRSSFRIIPERRTTFPMFRYGL